ncbi:hypothetical protein D9M68_390440 [compost metagenome]
MRAADTLRSWLICGVSSLIVTEPPGALLLPDSSWTASENCSRSMLRRMSVPSVPTLSVTVVRPSAPVVTV